MNADVEIFISMLMIQRRTLLHQGGRVEVGANFALDTVSWDKIK